ncbi:pseudouridine synthase [uncultured Vibrio sp.]|uniref:pseudouridine synthase n=1 Tax=uncultured Vibrio sp. TaxID=114054 RepID=UPI0026139CCB|nr:pseudouridine synthase [uncultured Vibrio sp.]
MCSMWCRRLMRLDKYLCKSTDLTKHEAVERIHNGVVMVNSETVRDESTQVHESNSILLNGDRLKLREFRYLLMHKPAGTICSNIDEFYPSLFNLIEIAKSSELHIAGRLDADTTGLVLITDDGRWSFNITQPNKSCKKVYRVTLSRDVKDDVADKFKAGVQLQGEPTPTRPAELKILSSKQVLLTITEGKFHQVKRMFAAVGNRVVALHREQIGNVCLDVEEGQWRYLTQAEVGSFS